MKDDGARYAFNVEWLDPNSSIIWTYQLFYYTADGCIEMYDVKNRRSFLKRCTYPSISKEHLFIGSVITVYSRQLKVVGYGDEATRKALEKKQEKTLAIVKPDAGAHLGKIVNAIYRAGFTVAKMKMCRLSASDAAAFYEVHQGKPFFNTLVNFMSSGPITAMELVGEGAITRWRELIGPTDSNRARAEAPNSLRAAFGTDNTRNALHGSDAEDTSEQERRFFFSGPIGSCARKSNSTCCLVKPHAVKEGVLGVILDQIQSRFSITALEMFSLDRANANEFFEVYKGVVPEFNAMVDQLTSGPFVALEVSSDGGNPVNEFRDFAGPPDPEIARVLRPHTLRAQFGKDKVHNAVHATDLEEDGPLEVNYFFDVLQT
eukprot:jgi/Mesvir1/7073/Mv09185-RA.1